MSAPTSRTPLSDLANRRSRQSPPASDTDVLTRAVDKVGPVSIGGLLRELAVMGA